MRRRISHAAAETTSERSSVMRSLHLVASLLLLASGLLSHQAAGQGNENIPLPEYYGLYALIDGKLCGLDVPTADCSLKTVEVKMGRRAAVGQVLRGDPVATTFPVKAFQVQKGMRFLIYRENPTAVAELLKLTPMLFVRKVTVDTGWPNKVRRSGVENGWDTGNPSELGGEMGKLNESAVPIRMLVKPLKPNMVLAVPSKEITPGLYHFALGQDIIGNQAGIYFWNGRAEEAESLKCVDATYEYAMAMSTSKYAPCGDQPETEDAAAAEAAASADADAGGGGAGGGGAAPPPGGNVREELTALKARWNEALRTGDKSFFETYLAENFTYADTGNRRYKDRAKFLSGFRKRGDIKAMTCGEYKVSAEGETATLSGVCNMRQEAMFLKVDARQAFTHRFIRKDDRWLFLSAEEIILPNR